MNTNEAIRNRYSCLAYIDKPIKQEKLASIMEVPRPDPSAGNMQDWCFVVVGDKETRAKLVAASNNQSFPANTRVVPAVCSSYGLTARISSFGKWLFLSVLLVILIGATCGVAGQAKKVPTVFSILKEAEREVRDLDKSNYSRQACVKFYASVAGTCAKSGRAEEGKLLVSRAIEIVRGIETGPADRSVGLFMLISEMLRVIVPVADALGDKGEAQKCRVKSQSYLEEALRMLEGEESDVYSKALTQTEVALAYLDIGLKDKSSELTKAAAKATLQDRPDDNFVHRCYAMVNIAELYYQLGDRAAAQAEIQTMFNIFKGLPQEMQDDRFIMIDEILDACMTVKDYEDAVWIARELKDYFRLVDLVDVYFGIDDPEKGEGLLIEAVACAEFHDEQSGEEGGSIAHTRGLIAVVYAKYGKRAKAEKCLGQVEQVAARELPDYSYGLFNWTKCQVQAYLGDYDSAMDTMRLNKDRNNRCRAMIMIMDKMIERGGGFGEAQRDGSQASPGDVEKKGTTGD